MSNNFGPSFELADYRPAGEPARAWAKFVGPLQAGDTITIGSDVYTFGIDFSGESEARAMLSLTAAIRGLGGETYFATSDDPFKGYSAYMTGSKVVLYLCTPGIAGNAFALATNAPSRIQISGATFTDGSAAAPIPVFPAAATGLGFDSVQTAATGTNYTALASHVCQEVTIVNDTGTALQFLRNATGNAFTLADGFSKTFQVLANSNELSVRRKDTSNTQVTMSYEWVTRS